MDKERSQVSLGGWSSGFSFGSETCLHEEKMSRSVNLLYGSGRHVNGERCLIACVQAVVKNFLSLRLVFLKLAWGLPTGEQGYKTVVCRPDGFLVWSSFSVGGSLRFSRPHKSLNSERSHEECKYIYVGKLPPRAREMWHLYSFWILTRRKAVGLGFWNK